MMTANGHFQGNSQDNQLISEFLYRKLFYPPFIELPCSPLVLDASESCIDFISKCCLRASASKPTAERRTPEAMQCSRRLGWRSCAGNQRAVCSAGRAWPRISLSRSTSPATMLNHKQALDVSLAPWPRSWTSTTIPKDSCARCLDCANTESLIKSVSCTHRDRCRQCRVKRTVCVVSLFVRCSSQPLRSRRKALPKKSFL